MIAQLASGLSGPMLLAAGAAWLLILVGAAFLLRLAEAQRRLRRRLAYAIGAAPTETEARGTSLRGAPMAALTALGRFITQSGLLPARTVAELKQTLAASGFRGSDGLWLFIGAKIAAFTGLPLLALFAPPWVTCARPPGSSSWQVSLGAGCWHPI
jgi:tight adherence protein C